MSNLIELKDAAQMLGLTPEQLADLRSRNEIAGYRDGSTWKFKREEVDRLREKLASAQEGPPGRLSPGDSGVDADLDELIDVSELQLDAASGSGLSAPAAPSGTEAADEGDEGDELLELEGDVTVDDSILVSDLELGPSGESGTSTIIGKRDGVASAESDIELVEEVAPEEPAAVGTGSGLTLDLGDVEPAAATGSGTGSDVLNDGSRAPGAQPDASETANLTLEVGDLNDEALTLESGSLEVTNEEDVAASSRVDLGDDTGGGSASSLSGFESGVALDLEGDDELVLGSGKGSDVTLGAGDSGINLANPSDSGLSLEVAPVELSGSAVDSLELGEDDMLQFDLETSDPESATQLKADDDFRLTPVDDSAGLDSDSGSQVIALDTEEFDESAATLLATQGTPILEEEADLVGAEQGAPLAPTSGLGVAPLMPAAEIPEAPYSIWNVLSLLTIVLVLSFTGILMMDLVKNIWSWEGTYSFNSTIMDKIIEMLSG